MTKCSTYCFQILYYKPTYIRSDFILRFTRNILIRLDFFVWHISARDVHPIFKQRLHIPHYKAFKIVWFTHLHVHLKEIDKPIHKKTFFILSVIWVRNDMKWKEKIWVKKPKIFLSLIVLCTMSMYYWLNCAYMVSRFTGLICAIFDGVN